MYTIETPLQIQDMARGAVLLGTGGGGDPYVGEMFVTEQIRRGRLPRIIDLDELADDAFVLSIAGIGAPTVGTEHLISERLLTDLLARAEAFHGRRVDALISVEIGGGNSITPLALGAIADLPVVDADGVGRAVPQIEMTAFSIYGCPASPLLIADAIGNSMIVNATTDHIAEDLCRAAAGALGAHVTSALYPMSGADAKRVSIRGSLSLAYGIGRCIREAREGTGDIFEELTRYLESWGGRRAAVLFDGKITDVRHETRNGWHWGQATLTGLRDDRQTCVVDIRNEFLTVRVNGRVVTMMPDLITILDRNSAEPMTAGMLAYGQRVKVLGFAADPMLRHPKALEVLGPRVFGIDEDFVPIEQLIERDAWPDRMLESAV